MSFKIQKLAVKDFWKILKLLKNLKAALYPSPMKISTTFDINLLKPIQRTCETDSGRQSLRDVQSI